MFPVQKTCSLVGKSDGGQRGGHGLDGGQVDPERRQLTAAGSCTVCSFVSASHPSTSSAYPTKRHQLALGLQENTHKDANEA